jgi:hypothetical protein
MSDIINSLKYHRITHTFISGKSSSTLIIPIEVARKYGFDKPTDVIVEDCDDGIMIKRLVL